LDHHPAVLNHTLVHGCIAWLWALALAGHANAINPTTVSARGHCHNNNIIRQFTAFHSSSICRVSRDPIFDFKSEATSSSSSSLTFPAKLVANICFEFPYRTVPSWLRLTLTLADRPVYFELEFPSLSAGLTILANAEPFIIAKGAASQRPPHLFFRRIYRGTTRNVIETACWSRNRFARFLTIYEITESFGEDYNTSSAARLQ